MPKGYLLSAHRSPADPEKKRSLFKISWTSNRKSWWQSISKHKKC